MLNLNKKELKDLDSMASGRMYSESLYTKAIASTDDLELKICLKAQRMGRGTFETRMTIQEAIVKTING